MSVAPLSPLVPISPNSIQAYSAPAPASTGGSVFATILNELVTSNNQANAGVDQAITALATGEAQDLHTVGIAVAQADLNFRLLIEIRNRLTEAFQEVLRTQI